MTDLDSDSDTDIIKPISNTSPLRYPGGKTRACKKLDEILNQNFTEEMNNKSNKSFDTVVSPFFGGGSFEFHLQNKYNLNIIANDKFKPLYNFWNICKNNDNDNDNEADKLCKALYNDIATGISKEKFLEYRKNVLIETDKIKQAEQYFIINRCSFSGATLSGGFSQEASKKRFTKSSVDRIKALDLSKFQIHNKDFEDFIKETYQTSNLQTNTNKNQLLFLDPPYYLEKKSKLYGTNGDMHENFEHKKLFDLLSNDENKNIKFMMTYNNCDYIKDLYSKNKNCKILDVNWSYGMNKSKESLEIVIFRN
jgi:DNA adenine methylase